MAHFPFQRLQADLAVLISETPTGQRLQAEPDLAKTMGVSRATLREAMRTFETQGLIRRRQGSGTYVIGKPPVIASGLEVLESLETLAQRMGLPITVGELHVEKISADEEQARIFDLRTGSPLTRVRRVICASRRPVAFLVDTLPANVLVESDLLNDFRGSVLDFLLARGDSLSTSRAHVSAIGATSDVARSLEIQRGDVLLHFDSSLYDANGRIVDEALSYFIPGHFDFHIVRRVGES